MTETYSEHHFAVNRTARFYLLGNPKGQHLREIWYICHGYGQLARFFLNKFEFLAQENRLIVAPEALSRFYLSDKYDKVGATWMTREDRLSEILDNIAYLTKLHAHIFEMINTPKPLKVNVLGFSQGTATIWRWVLSSGISFNKVVLWAGMIPLDIDVSKLMGNFNISLSMVYGTQDDLITPEKVNILNSFLQENKLKFNVYTFEGGHVLNDAILKQLFEENEP